MFSGRYTYKPLQNHGRDSLYDRRPDLGRRQLAAPSELLLEDRDHRCAVHNQGARVLWRYERAAWLYERGEVVLFLDEKPYLQAVARRVATQPMRPGQIERREFEDKRQGTVTFLAALHVYAVLLTLHNHMPDPPG
jgi:hypothetical protein